MTDPWSWLLPRVHDRLGGLGVDISTFGDGTVEARWRRDYDGEWSDERFTSGHAITEVLEAILAYEDEADAAEEKAP